MNEKLLVVFVVVSVLCVGVVSALFDPDIIILDNSHINASMISIFNDTGNITGTGTPNYISVWNPTDSNLLDYGMPFSGSHASLYWINPGYGDLNWAELVMDTNGNSGDFHLLSPSCLMFNDNTRQCTAATSGSGGNASIENYTGVNHVGIIKNDTTIVPSELISDNGSEVYIQNNTYRASSEIHNVSDYGIYTLGTQIIYWIGPDLTHLADVLQLSTTNMYTYDSLTLFGNTNVPAPIMNIRPSSSTLDATYIASKSSVPAWLWGFRNSDSRFVLEQGAVGYSNLSRRQATFEIGPGKFILGNASLQINDTLNLTMNGTITNYGLGASSGYVCYNGTSGRMYVNTLLCP